MNDILINTIPKNLISEKWKSSIIYEKKMSAVSGKQIISTYYELTVNCTELNKKEIENTLLGCAENLDENHRDFIRSLNDQSVLLIQSLLWKYMPFPLTDLNRIPDIYNSVYRYLHGNILEYVKAIKNFELDFSMMSLTEYFERLQAPIVSLILMYVSHINHYQNPWNH